jgi:hypothetical protein
MFTRSKAVSQPDRPLSVPLFEIVNLHCGNQVSRAGSRQAKWDNTINQPTTCLRLSYTYKCVVLFQRESANVVNGCSTNTKKIIIQRRCRRVERKTRCQNHDTDTADLFLIVQFNIGLCLYYKTGSNNTNFKQTRPTVLSKILPICFFWSTTILQHVRPRVRGHHSVNFLPFQNRTMPSTTKISENSITSTQQLSSKWASKQPEHATNTTHIMYNVCF